MKIGDHLYVEALAPGIDPDSLDLAVVHNLLTICGEKCHHPDIMTLEAFHRHERAAGKFVRTIELPVAVEAEQTRAAYQQGLLTVTLPMAATARPK
jgi:HSP20 family protein